MTKELILFLFLVNTLALCVVWPVCVVPYLIFGDGEKKDAFRYCLKNFDRIRSRYNWPYEDLS